MTPGLITTLPPKPAASSGMVADMMWGMPRSDDAEKGVLSCFLQNPAELLADALGSLPAEAFYHAGNRLIYEELQWISTHKPGTPIDIVTFSQHLIDGTRDGACCMDKIGGPATLAELLNFVPTPAHYHYYTGILRDKLLLRRIIHGATEVIQQTYELEESPADVLSHAQKTFLEINSTSETKGPIPFAEAVQAATDELQYMHQHQGEVLGLQCGLADLDRMLNGFEPEDRIIIGARPSDGKTSFLMTVAVELACVQGRPGLIFSLDGKAKGLAKRAIGARSGVPLHKLRTGFGSKEEWKAIGAAALQLSPAKLFIEEASGLSIYQIETITRRYKKLHGIEWIAVDYVQLVTCPMKKQEDPRIEQGRVSIGLMNLAKELGIFCIELAQLNRKADDRARPKLAHLKECGQYEQDATKAILLSRDDRDWEEIRKDDEIDQWDRDHAPPPRLALGDRFTIADVVKNKDGPTGPIWLRLAAGLTKFDSFVPGKKLFTSAHNKDGREALHAAAGSADTAEPVGAVKPKATWMKDKPKDKPQPAPETQPNLSGAEMCEMPQEDWD